jgi:hypothetical protein
MRLTLRLHGHICWTPWFVSMVYARCPVARVDSILSSSLEREETSGDFRIVGVGGCSSGL